MNNLNKINLQAIIAYCEAFYGRQKEYLILWWPICLGLGISIYFSLPHEPSLTILTICAALFLGATYKYKQIGDSRFIFLFFVALILLGMVVGVLRTHSVDAPVLEKELRFTNVEGVIEKVEDRGTSKRILLRDVNVEGLQNSDTPKFIQLTMRQKQDLNRGQMISVLASIRPPSEPVMLRGFDFQRYFYFKQIGATGFTLSKFEIIGDGDPSKEYIYDFLYSTASSMKDKVVREDSYANPIVKALLTGDRAMIDDYTWSHLKDSGLSHMLAISGLHVGLFSATVFFTIRLLLSFFPIFALRFQTKKIAAVAAFMAALFYTLLVGASVPTTRACLMTGMFFLAILMDRSPFSVHLLAFAAFLVMVLRPESLLSASFQMSFAAVMGLIIFYTSTRSFWVRHYANSNPLYKVWLYLLSICATTVIATIVTMPFTLYHFQHISVYGILGNLMAVPIMGFVVMPMAVFSYVMLPFDLTALPLAIMRWGVERIIDVSEFVGSLEGVSATMPTMPFYAFCLWVLGGLLFMSIRGYEKIFGVVLVGIAIVSITLASPADILVSDDGRLWAIHEAETTIVSDGRKGRFIKNTWLDYLGEHKEKPLTAPKSGCEGQLCCDTDMCFYDRADVKVSFLKEKYAAAQACNMSDLVIAPFSIKGRECGARDIDWYSFKHDGAHAIWIDKGGDYKIKTVADTRGDRPWVK